MELFGLLKNEISEKTILVLSRKLTELPIRWGFLAASSSCLFAATDRIRSFPIFYHKKNESVLFSNSARILHQQIQRRSLNIEALLELRMAGYTTGNETLFNEIAQLQAGEMLLQTKNMAFKAIRYYRYFPKPKKRCRATLLDGLKYNTENTIKKLAAEANGRQILVPLSSGLDSRLILGLLRWVRYKNVLTFSYGPKGNHEARIASQVASHAGYPWEFVCTNHAENREFFHSKNRDAYWKFSDSLCCIPNMQDIVAISSLIKKKRLKHDCIVVNGQSGDFISGGHVPPSLYSKKATFEIIKQIYKKHYSLRKSLSSDKNRNTMHRRIYSVIQKIDSSANSIKEAAGLYESWEWQERQCKYVVNGQRIYDWFGLDWRLPLWETPILDFWEKVPWEYKQGQALYKEYLQKFNYGDLFKKHGRAKWPWFGWSTAVPLTGKLIQIVAGKKVKASLYSAARYWGLYGPQYGPFGIRKFLSECHDIRNVIALFVDTWIQENDQILCDQK